MFKVVTNEGVIVNQGEQGKKAPVGLDEAMAKADAKDRNERAEALGIKTRYEVAPL